jgi:hypothetical protein
MIFRAFGLLLTATLSASCAARADLDALDVRTESGRTAWEYSRGTVCDFRSEQAICITGADDGRRQDVSSTISDVVAKELPGFKNRCDDSRPRIRVEYNADYSRCTHCPPPGLSTRFVIAIVRVQSPTGWTADATWTDTQGGSADQAAERFAYALAAMLREAASPACH